jgi:hypothetical protein
MTAKRSTANDTDEHLFVEVFLKAAGLQYQFEKQEDGDGPDFLLWDASTQLGLEVTRVHRDTEDGQMPRRQMEGIRDSLMDHAKREWDARALPPVRVNCDYNDKHTPLLKNEMRTVAQQLVEVVRAALPPVGSSVRVGRDYDSPGVLPKALRSLTIVRLKSYDTSYWFSDDGARGTNLSPERVQERIAAKNAKFERYDSPSRETWLLVVMDNRRLSAMMSFGGEAAEHEYSSLFARTFLLDLLYLRLWQLRTRHGGTGSAA